MKKRILLLLLSASFTGCIMDYYDCSLYVVNKSSIKIAVDIVNDTTKRIENNIEYFQSVAIKPNDTSFITKSGKDAWREYLEESPDKTLYVYFYSVDTLNKYQGSADMDYLRGNKKYIKRIAYTADELKKADWGIIFK